MKKIIFVTVLLSMIGCGSEQDTTPADADPCAIGVSDVTAFGDCKVKLSNGLECVTNCGRLPEDGGIGSILPVGCTVNISASTIEFGTCVASCSDCH